MKPFHLNRLFTIMALSAMLFSSCGDSPVPSQEEFAPFVSFSITLSSENSVTRADGESSPDDPFPGENWNDNHNTDSGTDFDRRIVSVTPVLYEVKEGRLVTDAPAGVMKEAFYDRDNYSGLLKISGQLDTEYSVAELEKREFRLAVFVNAPDVDIRNPENAMFSQHGVPDTAELPSIPMYGVGKADFHGLSVAVASKEDPFSIKNDQTSDDLLQIDLLRAMAKVKVRVSNDLFSKRDMKLHHLHISRHSKSGFVIPSGWDTAENTADLGIAKCMNAPKGNELKLFHDCRVMPLLEKDDLDENSWTMLRLYIPETYNYLHDGIETEELTLTVEYFCDGDEEVRSHKILFRRYEKGVPVMTENPWDLIRNHVYEYVVTGIDPLTGDLRISLDADWERDHTLDLE